jgi:hypothetical protein
MSVSDDKLMEALSLRDAGRRLDIPCTRRHRVSVAIRIEISRSDGRFKRVRPLGTKLRLAPGQAPRRP